MLEQQLLNGLTLGGSVVLVAVGPELEGVTSGAILGVFVVLVAVVEMVSLES